MSQPKHMTTEQVAAKKAYHKEYGAKHRRENAEAERLRKMKWRHDNPKKAKAMDARAKAKNPPRRLALRRNKYNENKEARLKEAEEYRLKNPNKRKDEIEQLAPSYIAGCLGLKVSELRENPRLLEAKKNQLKTLRILKTIKKQIDENTNE